MTGALFVGNLLSATLGNRGVCEDLTEGLRRRGWRLVTTSSRPGRVARLADMLATSWRKRRLYAVAHVDVFSGPSFLWAEAVCVLLRLIGRPYVLTLHGGNLPAFAHLNPVRVRRLLRSAAAVTTPSPYMVRRLKEYRDDIELLPNAVDPRQFSFRHRPNPGPKLIWLRAFHWDYNPQLAVETVAVLKDQFPGVELLMYGADRGDGSLAATRQAAQRLGVARHVRISGAAPFSEVPRRLDEADIFLNTTDCESFGVSVVEAAAAGLCIVSTNAGALPSIWSDGDDALLVPQRDPAAMAAAVRAILVEPGLGGLLSSNARRSAGRFERESILTRWEGLLNRAGRMTPP
ncbi:MAG: glycosyltransferase family 4 protein [Acidobacteria bacterium]|nr:glycosyltransferase family 4 protein [Acidobacteriota bacterium]